MTAESQTSDPLYVLYVKMLLSHYRICGKIIKLTYNLQRHHRQEGTEIAKENNSQLLIQNDK